MLCMFHFRCSPFFTLFPECPLALVLAEAQRANPLPLAAMRRLELLVWNEVWILLTPLAEKSPSPPTACTVPCVRLTHASVLLVWTGTNHPPVLFQAVLAERPKTTWRIDTRDEFARLFQGPIFGGQVGRMFVPAAFSCLVAMEQLHTLP